jgi:crossover junction endodeoxyribonuclease RuvC
VKKIFIGIDPGLDGAAAALDQSGKILFCEDTPTITVRSSGKNRRKYLVAKMAEVLRPERLLSIGEVVVGIEAVHAMPQQGVTSMFNMGYGLGLWIGIVTADGLSLEMVPPQSWKKAMRVSGPDKGASIVRALELFPTQTPALLSRKKDHGRADALLIAEYLRRRASGAGKG